jgi:hypothetical protein
MNEYLRSRPVSIATLSAACDSDPYAASLSCEQHTPSACPAMTASASWGGVHEEEDSLSAAHGEWVLKVYCFIGSWKGTFSSTLLEPLNGGRKLRNRPGGNFVR